MLLSPLALLGTSVWHWILHLRGPGLVLLGIADNSLVPLTGSMDVLTIWLAASNRNIWPYYAFMATLGAVLGGYITYALARRGGKEAFEHKVTKKSAEKITRRFERWGFWSVFTSAILPPPFPLVPVLLAAGALQYSRQKFLLALSFGRAIRYLLVAGLGALYGDAIVSFFSRYYKPALQVLVGLAVLGSTLTLIKYLRSRHKHTEPATAQPHHKAA